MRIEGKMKVLALCVILIFPNLLISSALGEVDIKKAIIGKWGQYDQKLGGIEYFEFFEDGTVFTYHDGLKMSAGGDYKFIDKNRIRINLSGIWSLVGPVVCKVSVSGDTLILTLPDGKVEEYKKGPLRTPKIVGPSKDEKQTKQQIAGYVAEFNNLDTLLQGVGGAVLRCPKQSCDDYEEEAAKVLISHLLTKKSGKWLSGFVAWQVAKKLILSGLDELIQMAISLGEVGIEKIIGEIKHKFEKSNGADVKVVSLGWKDIGVLPIYLPYKNRDGRYGNVDGEALMVFYSPHSISIKEIKEQIKSGGGRVTLYVPPIGLDEKVRQLPDVGIVRPFKLIIRGTVYELGEVKTYESWGETIKGPRVTFLEDKDSVSPTESVASIKDFERVLERVPPKNYTVSVHQDLKPVLISIFGGAELISHFDRSNFSCLVYTLKRQIRSTGQVAIKKMLETKGYKYEFTKGSPGLEAFFFRKNIGGKVYGIKLGLGLDDQGVSVVISDSWSQLLTL